MYRYFVLIIAVLIAWPDLEAQKYDSYLKGLAKMEYQEPDSAIKYFSDAIKENPEKVIVLMKRGEAYYQIKNYSEAKTDFEKVEKLKPGMASLFLSRIYAQEQDLENAVKWLKVHLKSTYREEKSIVRLDDAFNTINNTKEWNTIWMEDWYTEYDIAVESADYFRKNEEYVDAIEEFDKIIDQYPNMAKTYEKRANVYMLLDDNKSAMRDLTSAIDLDPDNYSYYHNRGRMYENMRKHKKALDDYNKAIKMNPYDIIMIYERGLIKFKMQYYKEAIEDISTYINYYNRNEKAYYSAGIIYNTIKDYEKAKEMLDILIKMNSGVSDYYIARIETFEGLENYTQMLTDCNNALDLDPKNGYIFFKRGLAKLNLKNRDGACKDWSNAVRNGYFDANEYIHNECQN